MLQVSSRRLLGLVLSLFALSVAPRLLHAQSGKVAGTVTDAANGQPLEGVQVFLQGTGYGNVTNSNGRFFILTVPPGTYTVTARRIGYQTVQQNNVQVSIDVTRDVNFAMPTAGVNVGIVKIQAVTTPLIEPGQTGSQIPITAAQIQALPVTSIEQALSLQQGFVQAPNSTDIISFAESRRNAQNPVYIRGGRGGETLMLIDGIPVNNFIYGGPALSLSPEAVNQVDFLKGGMGPEYGNALSGIINIATKEGGTDLAGEVSYQTSRLGGALGNEADDLRDYNLVEGFFSGPVPATSDRLRFIVSGRQERQADAVLQFDNQFFLPSIQESTEALPARGPNFRDIIPGWRAFGFHNTRQVFGKLAFVITPTARLTGTFLDNQVQRKPYDFQYFPTYGKALGSPAASTPADSAVYIGNLPGYRLAALDFEKVVENSINSSQRLYAGTLKQTLGRTSYSVTAGAFQTDRTTCNYFQGVCLKDQFGETNFTDDRFIGPLAGTCAINPTCGTDTFYGGEKLTTQVLRGDLESQITDHHNLRGGVLYQRYDLKVNVTQQTGQNTPQYSQNYANKPYDFGTYLQDKIEYDFLTLKLGARFDYGKVPGTFFANPLDPTNGTTAVDVCKNPSDPRWAAGTRFGFLDENGIRRDTILTPNPAWATTGCSPDDIKLAAKIATFDDFKAASARKQFSPRIGVSFPLSQSSSVFFNFGRYSQNPLLNNLLTNTGIGTPSEGLTGGPRIFAAGSGVGTVGNPNLKIEQSTNYEMGYNQEFGGVYALGATLFNKNESGLTGLRQGGQRLGKFGFEQVFDPGLTYSPTNTPSYTILVNQDYQTVRGFELQLRRRVQSYWGFDINYSYSKARTNASEPQREIERQLNQGDPNNLNEVPSDLDQTHVFNASLIGQVQENIPKMRSGWLLRNTTGSLTVHAASGFPYTPVFDFFGFGLNKTERNSARGPNTLTIDAALQKGFHVSNLRYTAFLQAHNILDRKNCIQVFDSTGSCEAGAIDQSRARQGNSVRPDIATSTLTDRPDFFGERRTIFGGVRVSF